MNVLFVTFGELSIGSGAVRSISLLRALADAGYHVDVVAALLNIAKHPNINIVEAGIDRPLSRRHLQAACLKALRKKTYHLVHAVDDAVLAVMPVARWRRIKVVYEASRCFSGPNGIAPLWRWKLFPTYFQRKEKRMLRRVAFALTESDVLAADLARLEGSSRVVCVEGIPAHPLLPCRDTDRKSLLARFDGKVSGIVACRVMPGNRNELRKLLLAVRKVIETHPQIGFFFKGVPVADALSLARNLEIQGRCAFLDKDDVCDYLSSLEVADAVLFVPEPGGRYASSEVLTLLHSPAPLLAVQASAYKSILNEKNSIQVVASAEAIAEGIVRIFEEPLLSFAIAIEGQQLIADHHSFSSFKHRIRMTYHDL